MVSINRKTGFDLSDQRGLSIEDKLTHWRDWEVEKFERYGADLHEALEALRKRPKPDDCAGRFARARLEAALKTVESHLAALDPAPVEAARKAALVPCQDLNAALDKSHTAATVEEQLHADASIKVAEKMQAARWDEFVKAATAARLPLVSTLPLHDARARSQRAARLDEITHPRDERPSAYAFGYTNIAVEVAANHARDAARDLESFVWDIVDHGARFAKADGDQLDAIEVFLGEAMRKAGLEYDTPQVFETDAAEGAAE